MTSDISPILERLTIASLCLTGALVCLIVLPQEVVQLIVLAVIGTYCWIRATLLLGTTIYVLEARK